MIQTSTKQIAIFVAGAVLAFLAILFFTSTPTKASAPNGLPATIATTSVSLVNTTASLVIATSSCSARIISTATSSIMIGFTDNQGFVPSAMQGIYQAASTTVAYDSGQYGCGAVRVYSFQTQNLTVMDAR